MIGIDVHDARIRCSASVGLGVHLRPDWPFMMGRITHLTNEPTGYVLSVTNAGEPIPPEIPDHIFERFFRSDTARTPVDGGAGLGLALARWVAWAHGGDVTLARTSPEGTTFAAVLPSQS